MTDVVTIPTNHIAMCPTIVLGDIFSDNISLWALPGKMPRDVAYGFAFAFKSKMPGFNCNCCKPSISAIWIKMPLVMAILANSQIISWQLKSSVVTGMVARFATRAAYAFIGPIARYVSGFSAIQHKAF